MRRHAESSARTIDCRSVPESTQHANAAAQTLRILPRKRAIHRPLDENLESAESRRSFSTHDAKEKLASEDCVCRHVSATCDEACLFVRGKTVVWDTPAPHVGFF